MDRRRAAGTLLALAACVAFATAAPTAGNHTSLDLYDGAPDGCYYNFQHYGEGDRIMTNEPCLNCTCHNRMLMCYLRVCPFTKPIGQDCTIEKRADQCCPIVTCPDVPVDLLTSTTTSPAEYGSTGMGKLDKFGCSIDGKYFSEGSKVPPTPNKPCEHCYCIRNMTTCVMQECTLHVDGCTPIYHKDVCCPVRYSCDHPEDEMPLLDDMSTTVRPTPGFLLTTTTLSPVTQISQDCVYDNQIFPDGALIKTEKACDHCYCMKGDIVCVVQECGTPMENEGKNCTALPPREGVCCPDTYICEGDEPTTGTFDDSVTTTEMPQESILTLSPPRKTSEGRYEDKVPTELPFPEPEVEGSGDQVTEGVSQSSTAEDTEEPHEYISVTPKVPEQIPEDITSSPAIQPATEKYDDQDLGSGEEDIETKDKEETSSEASPNIERTESSTPSDFQKIKPTSEPESEISHSDETSVPSILENEQTSPHEKEYFTTEQYGEPSVTKVSTEVKESATTDGSPQTTPSSEDIAEKTTTTESSDSNILPTIAEEPLEKEPIQPESHSSSTTVTSNVDDEISTESPESVTESVENTDMNPETLNVVTSSTPQLEEIEEETTELKDQKPTTVDDLIPSTPSASPLPVDTDDKQVETEIPEEFSTEHIPTPSPTLPSDLVTTLPESDIKESDEDHATDMDQYEPTTKGPIDDIEKKTTQSDITSVAEESSAQTTEEPDKGLNTIPSGSVDEEPSITEQSIDQTETTKKPTMADEKDIETTSEPIHDDLRTESPTEPKSTVPEQYETSSQSPSLDEDKSTSPTPTSEIEPTASVDQGTESAEDVKETETEKEVVEPIEATSESAYVPTNAPEKETSAEVTETTTANQEENEIINESRIPGEGDCLVNGVTYQNESSVPSTNKCQTGCKCVSSILKCDPIICSEPLESMDNCRTVYDSPDSCCPTYICDQNTETLPPQSHNQMSGTDKPTITPAVECDGDECAIVEPSKETQESCTSEGCTNKSESSPEITKPQEEIIKPCNSETGCQSVPVADCKGQDCQPSDEVLPQEETIKPCNSETGCQSVPVADCKGQDCQPSDEVLPQEETIKPCNSETGCQSLPVADCNGQDCQPSDNVPPAETQPCDGESCNIPTEVVDDRKDSCQDGEKCELPQSIPEKCIGESCRRKEPSGLDSEKPSEETSGKPIEDDLETKMPLETTTSSSLHDLTIAPERLPEEPESPATTTIEKSEVVTKSPDSEQHEDGQKSEDGQKPDDESTTETLSTITEPSDLDTRFDSVPTKSDETSSDVPKVTETTANEEVVTEVAEQTTEPTVKPLVTDNESDQSIPSEDDTTKYNEPEQDHTTLSTLNEEATTKKAEIEDTEIMTKSPIADEIETKQPEEASNEPSVPEQDSQAVTDEVSETTSKTTDEEAESTSDKDLASATELPETSISETYETTTVLAKDESNIEAEKEEEENQTLSSMLPIEDETVTAGPAAEPTEKSPSSDEKPEDEKLIESVKPTTPAETDKPSEDKLEESSDTPAIPEIVTEEPSQSSDTEPMATTSKQDNEPETATEPIETTNVPTSETETDSSKTQDDVTPDSSSITTESSVDNKQQSETTLAPITDSVEPITATSPTLVEKPIENADDSLRTTVIPESIEDASSKKPEEDLSESSVTTETSSDENEPTTPKSEKIPEINEPEPETEQETTIPDTEQKKETLSPVSDGLSTEPSKTDMRDNEPEIPQSPELVTIGPEIVDDEMKVTESPTVDSDATTQSAVDKPLPTVGDEKVESETATEQNEVTDKTSPQSEEDQSTEPIKTIPETKPSEEDADISTKEPMDTDENVETSKPDDEDSQQVDKEQTTTPISQKDDVSEDSTTKSSDILDKEPETGGTTTRIDEIEDSKVPTESSEPTSAQDYEPERATTPAPLEPHAPTETVEIQTPVSEIIDTPTRDSEKEPEKEVTSSEETSNESTESAVEPTQSSDEQKPESDSTEKDLSVTEGSDSQESTTSANVNKIEATVSEPTATESIQNQPEEMVTVPKEVESTVTKSPEEAAQIPTETDEAQPETHITDGPVTEPVEIDEVATEVNVIQQKTTAAESDVELTTKSPVPDFEDHRRTYNPVELSTETSITNTVESESVTTPRVENQVTEEPEKIQPTESELESIPEKSTSSPVMDVVEDISTMKPETKPSENIEPSSDKPIETENLTEQPIQSVTSETDIMEPMGTKQPVDQAEMQTTQPPIIEEETSTKVDKYEQPDVTSEKEPIEDEKVTVAPTTEALEDITSEPKPATSQENIEDTSESKTSTASPLITEAEKIEPSDEVTSPEQVITQAPEIKYSENIENVPTSTEEHSITAEVTESSQILTTESQKEKDETATEVPEKVTAIISDVTETSTEPSEGTSPKQQDEPIAPQEEPTSEDHKPLDVESTEKPVDELTSATEVPIITPDSVQEPESPQKETELPIKESTTDNVDETTVSRVEHPSTSSFAEEEPEKTTQAIVSETTATPAVVSEITAAPAVVSETTATPAVVSETTAAPAVVSETTAAPLDNENVTAEQPEIATEKDIRTSPQQPEMVTERDITTAQEEVSVPQVTEQVPVVTEKPLEDTITEEAILTTPKMTSTKAEEESSTAKPTEKATEPTPVQTTEAPKPSEPEDVPTPEEEPSFPPSGTSGYGEPDYIEEDQTFGPGTCRYGGKVYVSAQQIPRDDPCDFCFCFRSDIICLQQSCPPPIHGCHEEPIQGFCCPRYECPVSMATTVNVTTTTTTTTTTLPPHFPIHSYKGSAQRKGCLIKGQSYKVGDVVRSSSGPCLHCTCGGDGQMKCDPKVCTPEPMLRQMIAAAVASKRRR